MEITHHELNALLKERDELKKSLEEARNHEYAGELKAGRYENEKLRAWISEIFRNLGLPDGDMGALEAYIQANEPVEIAEIPRKELETMMHDIGRDINTPHMIQEARRILRSDDCRADQLRNLDELFLPNDKMSHCEPEAARGSHEKGSNDEKA